MSDPILPNAKELKALRLFVSSDETRPGLSTLWCYLSRDPGGATYVATDGHTLVCRRAGTHRKMKLYDVAKLPTFSVDQQGVAVPAVAECPKWFPLLREGSGRELAEAYSINPAYYARIGDVERTAGARDADDYVPKPGMAKKDVRAARESKKLHAFSSLQVPSDPLGAWYWKIAADSALWEGLIMPRRV